MESVEPNIDPNKYIVFKRDELQDLVRRLPAEAASMQDQPIPVWLEDAVFGMALPDAVVIRRQDLFAGPALHAYASSIGIASKLSDEKHLQQVADYFSEQAVLADAEGWKLPD